MALSAGASTTSMTTMRSRAVDHCLATPSITRSQFWGSGSVQVPSVAVKGSGATRAGPMMVRASFFDNLARLFSTTPAETEQVMGIYEINDGDRNSPQLLKLCPNPPSKDNTLGDLVPYTNKVYGPAGRKSYLGISAGLCTVIEHDKATGGDRFETTYTQYLGGFGQVSGMGPYYNYKDSEMVVTGGTGVFKGARGLVKIVNQRGPLQLLYTYYLTGIPTLPAELTAAPVPIPAPAGTPTPAPPAPAKV